ncbi:glycerophosphodiester phosphodiesterase [Myxococcus sp. K15C18031901]|uniref:glycerophosphodiester phosphodiesterase family protein n=1 Tax=Myxococcus dinghuensis TaxID=2906761 RepID=UPI0020A822D0|nr:glycerophosphodiester phosphodiesterase family protein [Myxococcus dinghuensis]MCP3099394.1 glycerophosphodiester phosphodiesterase [Myxococcus dinghuensis]
MDARTWWMLGAVVLSACTSSGGVTQGIQVGPRPSFLVDQLEAGPLKRKLQGCAEGPFRRTTFSIGHRGAPLQFPEHTQESYEAAARMGAGVLECDVTFTKDRQLVCRHSQCDLHATTNILEIPALAAKCTKPFEPADPATGRPASARCCTSDVTLAEFKQLCGKMDGVDPTATTVARYLRGTPDFRTDLYSTCGTLLSHQESITLFRRLGTKFTPELKAPSVPMPYEGDYTQAAYAQQLIDEYTRAGVPPEDVWPQSFQLEDVKYWLKRAPDFGRQAVFLDERDDLPGSRFDPNDPSTWEPSMAALAESGVRILAPPIYVLLTLDTQGRIIPSAYAREARAAGLDLITWSFEREGPLRPDGGYYFQSIAPALKRDGDMLVALDVLARDVGVLGVFSDWPGTVSYYASCMGRD